MIYIWLIFLTLVLGFTLYKIDQLIDSVNDHTRFNNKVVVVLQDIAKVLNGKSKKDVDK